MFAESEYEVAHALFCMTGFNVSTVLSNTLGLPAVSSLRRSYKEWRYELSPAVSYDDIVPSMQRTLKSFFKCRVLRKLHPGPSAPHAPVTLAIDEVALVKKLVFHMKSNSVLGLQLKRGVPRYMLEVEQHLADLAAAIKAGASLAALASVVAVSPLTDLTPRLPMSCFPIAVWGGPSKGRTAEHEVGPFAHMLDAAFRVLESNRMRLCQCRLVHPFVASNNCLPPPPSPVCAPARPSCSFL